MIITKTNLTQVSTAERIQSDRFGQALPLAGYQYPAAPFDGGNVS